jgi:hypothetical protein
VEDFESVPDIESTPKEQPKVLKREPTWIEWFCQLENNKYVEQIDPQFIIDTANHIDLYQKSNSLNFQAINKKRFTDCLRLILA